MEFMKDPRIAVPVIAGGLTFMVVKMAINLWSFDLTSVLGGLVAGAIAAGIGYGVVHFMGSRE
jgi:hypothetical protein